MRRKPGLLLALSLVVGFATAGAQKADDPAKLWPENYRVVLDNANVRVLEIRVAQGQKIPMHAHPAGVLINLTAFRVKFTYPDGKADILDARPGEAMWTDGFSHEPQTLVGAAHVLLVEVKGAKPPAPR